MTMDEKDDVADVVGLQNALDFKPNIIIKLT
jgi:hypothetical protein